MTWTIADQPTGRLGGEDSVLARQRRDHVELDRLLDELEGSRPADQPEVLSRVYRLVFPHAFAEEALLWPVARRRAPDGPRLTLHIEQEHQEIDELAAALDRTTPEADEWARTLNRMV